MFLHFETWRSGLGECARPGEESLLGTVFHDGGSRASPGDRLPHHHTSALAHCSTLQARSCSCRALLPLLARWFEAGCLHRPQRPHAAVFRTPGAAVLLLDRCASHLGRQMTHLVSVFRANSRAARRIVEAQAGSWRCSHHPISRARACEDCNWHSFQPAAEPLSTAPEMHEATTQERGAARAHGQGEEVEGPARKHLEWQPLWLMRARPMGPKGAAALGQEQALRRNPAACHTARGTASTPEAGWQRQSTRLLGALRQGNKHGRSQGAVQDLSKCSSSLCTSMSDGMTSSSEVRHISSLSTMSSGSK